MAQVKTVKTDASVEDFLAGVEYDTHLVYASGREGDWPEVGFAPRKSNLAIYVLDPSENYSGLRGKLGKHRVGKACLWINKLADVDLDAFEQIIAASLALTRSR